MRLADGSDVNFATGHVYTGKSALPTQNWRWFTDVDGNEQLIPGTAGAVSGAQLGRELGGAEFFLYGGSGT
jgi:hypothetical protein